MVRWHTTQLAVLAAMATWLGTLASSALAAPNHLVINEVQISGGPGHTTDDFIELYNPTGAPIDLKGHRLVKRTASSTGDTTIKSWVGSAIIPAGGYYLWANADYTTLGVKPNSVTSQSIASSNGIALRRGPTNTGAIIDSLAWGEARNGLGEGQLFPSNPAGAQSLVRKTDAGGVVQDTESNINDFVIALSPTPQATATLAPPQAEKPAANAPTPTSENPSSLALAGINATNSGQLITTTGRVTKVTKTTFTLQDGEAELRVALRDRTLAWPTLVVGAQVHVTGVTAVSRGQVELRPRTPADIVLRAPEPQAETIPITPASSEQRNGYFILALLVLVLGSSYLWQKLKPSTRSAAWRHLLRK